MSAPFYRIDFRADPRDEAQRTLDELYHYGDDVTTRVLARGRLNLFVRLFEDLVRRGIVTRRESALDVGCSAGIFAQLLHDFGFRRVLGIDVDEAALADARRVFGDAAEFRLQRAEELGTEEQFDFVLSTETIEHTDDPAAVARNIRAVLAPGGVAVISLPNRISLPYLVSVAAERLHRRPLDEELREHLRYPFYRSMRLLEGPGVSRVATAGSNLVLDPKLLGLLHGTRAFPTVNRANFELARRWPLKYAGQFFFVAFRKDPAAPAPRGDTGASGSARERPAPPR